MYYNPYNIGLRFNGRSFISYCDGTRLTTGVRQEAQTKYIYKSFYAFVEKFEHISKHSDDRNEKKNRIRAESTNDVLFHHPDIIQWKLAWKLHRKCISWFYIAYFGFVISIYFFYFIFVLLCFLFYSWLWVHICELNYLLLLFSVSSLWTANFCSIECWIKFRGCSTRFCISFKYKILTMHWKNEPKGKISTKNIRAL